MSPEELLVAVAESHAALLVRVVSRWEAQPLHAPVTLWSSPFVVATAVNYLSSEDFYHAGQLGYIRMASDPTWNYYGAIYD